MSHVGRPRSRDSCADVVLSEVGFEQRTADGVIGGRAAAGAEIAGVVEVAAVQDRSEPALSGDPGESPIKLVLAVEAAVRVVLHISRIVHLARVDQLVRNPDLLRERLSLLDLRGGHRWGDTSDGECAVAEDVMCDGGDERRVDAAGIGDDRRASLADDLVKPSEFSAEGGLDCHGRMIARGGRYRTPFSRSFAISSQPYPASNSTSSVC